MLICRELENRGFVNGFSTRLGGVSSFPANDLNLAGFDEDSSENIAENRRRFLALLAGDSKLATVWQVHGDVIKTILTPSDIRDSDDRADAVIANLTDVLAGVKTADCVPILIGDPATGAFAAIHAGWRGTVLSIAAKAVAQLVDVYNCNAADLICVIGPAASGKNYEVGQDVIDAFAANFAESGRFLSPTREGHALIDLHAANKEQLMNCGIDPSNIYIAPFCTIGRGDLFFSYRLEKKKYGKTGRLLSVIGRRAI